MPRCSTVKRDLEYQEGGEDRDRDIANAIAELSPDRFLHTGTDVEHKVKQLYGDRKAFDETPLIGACDLILRLGSPQGLDVSVANSPGCLREQDLRDSRLRYRAAPKFLSRRSMFDDNVYGPNARP